MMNRIVGYSIQNRFFVVLLALLLMAAGISAALKLPIDAVPDITTKQVAVNTVAPALAPLEIERQITFPIEVALSGMPHLVDLRSISQFGLSQVTVVFEDGVDIYAARQLVNERLQEVKEQLPHGVEAPMMGPISTGPAEIDHVMMEGVGSALMERRTILD